jgi:hypothetical protein
VIMSRLWDQQRREKQLERLRAQEAIARAHKDEKKRAGEEARIKAEEKALLHDEAVGDADEMLERRRLFWGSE